jgi:hypothetical protein
MDKEFNARAARSLVCSSDNFMLNLAAAPYVAVMESKGGLVLDFGAGTKFDCEPGEDEDLWKKIEAYNEAGGRYVWLFGNVAVNLDVASAVTVQGKHLEVYHPGGVWCSGDVEDARKTYNEFLADAREDTGKPDAKPKSLNL